MLKNILAVISLFLVFSGLFLLWDLSKEELITPPEKEDSEFSGETKGFPENIVLTDMNKGTFYYRLSDESGIYEKYKDFNEFEGFDIVRARGKEFFWNEDFIAYLPEEDKSAEFNSIDFRGEIGAVTAYRNKILVCAEGSLIVLDSSLEELGRVSLEISEGWVKNAHDIFVHNDIAYLLDNIMFPIYILKADIEDFSNPQIIERLQIYGINQHLDHQWLDTVNNQWAVVQSESTHGGYYLGVYLFDGSRVSDGKIARQNIYADNIVTNASPDGFEILSVTETTPIYALVIEGNVSGVSLAKIDHTVGEIFLGDKLLLTEEEEFVSSPRLKKSGEYLFAAYKNNMAIINTTDNRFDFVMNQSLQGAREIVDFVVY